MHVGAASYMITIILTLQKECLVFSASACFECSYRQKGGDENKNKQCLNPEEGSKASCPKDKPTCIKATAVTQNFGLVMERGCFPQMPSSCKDLEPLDNTDPAGLFFGATLSDVENGKDVKFEDVRACFCDLDGCNNEPGQATKSSTDTGGSKSYSRSSGLNDANQTSRSANSCSGQGNCEPRKCYTCKLGIECDRMRFVREEQCTKSGPCFVFTKFLATHNFTERGCGSCVSLRSADPDIEDRSQHCFNCNENLCNSLAVLYSSSMVYTLAVFMFTAIL